MLSPWTERFGDASQARLCTSNQRCLSLPSGLIKFVFAKSLNRINDPNCLIVPTKFRVC